MEKMETQTSHLGRSDRRSNKPIYHDYGWILFLVVGAVLVIGFKLFRDYPPYKPGDNVGYNIGLVGGLMMLTLLLYPLRKRFAFMKNFGILPIWFRWHMIFGILGPTLVLFHSTFRIGSINAGVALTCMSLVAGSGVFGRFFYAKIHKGLYGRQSSLRELQTHIDSNTVSELSFAPEIEQQLAQFRTQYSPQGEERRKRIRWGGFITVGIRAPRLSWKLSEELKHVMYAEDKRGGLNKEQLDMLYEKRKKFIHNYLRAVRDVSQFHTYEKLFSWWHILHIPLVYLMVFSGIYHVIAVHMY
ncbi:MAG: hypothetical protein HY306_13140 [Nitrosomonadales bacterium]|nr:hypothetical protein [Nitrosomonadales bacterium]